MITKDVFCSFPSKPTLILGSVGATFKCGDTVLGNPFLLLLLICSGTSDVSSVDGSSVGIMRSFSRTLILTWQFAIGKAITIITENEVTSLMVEMMGLHYVVQFATIGTLDNFSSISHVNSPSWFAMHIRCTGDKNDFNSALVTRNVLYIADITGAHSGWPKV